MQDDIKPPANDKPAPPPPGMTPLSPSKSTPSQPGPISPPNEPEEEINTGSGAPLRTEAAPSLFKEIISTVGILFTAFLVALFIVNFVFRSYQVDGPSMQNTLHNSDKLIIWKVPRTMAGITHHDYIPTRGEIIVFNQSGLSQYGQQDKKQLIKRVVALPGERVVVSNGIVTVYNKQHPAGFRPDITGHYFPEDKVPYSSGEFDKVLGPHELFVCGDNRPDSLDSRSFGPINASQVVGKLVLRVFPIDQAKKF